MNKSLEKELGGILNYDTMVQLHNITQYYAFALWGQE